MFWWILFKPSTNLASTAQGSTWMIVKIYCLKVQVLEFCGYALLVNKHPSFQFEVALSYVMPRLPQLLKEQIFSSTASPTASRELTYSTFFFLKECICSAGVWKCFLNFDLSGVPYVAGFGSPAVFSPPFRHNKFPGSSSTSRSLSLKLSQHLPRSAVEHYS